jgi:hypothetical protein
MNTNLIFLIVTSLQLLFADSGRNVAPGCPQSNMGGRIGHTAIAGNADFTDVISSDSINVITFYGIGWM